jgi:hypothetical protein
MRSLMSNKSSKGLNFPEGNVKFSTEDNFEHSESKCGEK